MGFECICGYLRVLRVLRVFKGFEGIEGLRVFRVKSIVNLFTVLGTILVRTPKVEECPQITHIEIRLYINLHTV